MNYTEEHRKYLQERKKEKRIILFFRILIIVLFITIWQLLDSFKIINSFLMSSPVKVLDTFLSLIKDGSLFRHLSITIYEVLISFSLSIIIGFFISSLLFWFPLLAKIFDPYLTILNSLPKVALGPLIIIWVGASIKSIIVMALSISSFITIINTYNAFSNVNKDYIKLLKTFKATKYQIFTKVIIPSNRINFINILKVNISMTLIGVIMGELLVSKNGLGYLIMYGSSVFNINLVITSVVILGIISYMLYYLVTKLESKYKKEVN